MKKRFWLLILFSTGIIVSYCQNIITDSSAQVIAYWKKGDKKRLNFKKVSEKGNANDLKIDSSKYFASLEVLEELKDGYKMKWQYDRVAANECFDLLYRDYPSLSKPLNIIYKTDEQGAFKEAINLNEIQTYVHETVGYLQNLIDTDKSVKNINNVKEALNQLKIALTGRIGIENIIMKEINYFHTFFGAEYGLNRKSSANIELPNAFGGEPFKARIEVDLKEVNKKDNLLTLEMLQFVDREQSKKLIIEILKKIMPADFFRDAESLEKEIKNFAIEDICTQKINAGNCWIKWMSYKRTVTVGNHRRLETIELTVN